VDLDLKKLLDEVDANTKSIIDSVKLNLIRDWGKEPNPKTVNAEFDPNEKELVDKKKIRETRFSSIGHLHERNTNVFIVLQGLSTAAYKMWVEFTLNYNYHTNQVEYSTQGMHKTLASRALSELKQKGLVKWVRRNHKSNPGVLMLNPRYLRPPRDEETIVFANWGKLK
jgi:hypothetical protein